MVDPGNHRRRQPRDGHRGWQTSIPILRTPRRASRDGFRAQARRGNLRPAGPRSRQRRPLQKHPRQTPRLIMIMNESPIPPTSRREFLKHTGRLAAASALAGVALPHVHAAEDNTIRLAIVGCGGRGTGAVANALEAPCGPVKLFAMADLFKDKLASSHSNLSAQFADKIDVPAERQFLGFDAYRKAIDCLRPGDVVLCTTHAAFRAIHVEYAIEKGMNVFMEKNFAPDPGGIKRILRAGEAAEKKGVRVAAGLMCRHSTAHQALIQKMRDGAMGDIHLIRAY